MMKKVAALTALGLGLASGAIGFAHAAPVSVSYYNNFTDTGTDVVPIGTPFMTDSIASINSSADPNFPGAGSPFAAIFSTHIDVGSSGTFTFNLGSDDASYLYIDGMEVGGLPGTHGYYSQDLSTMLTAGVHTLRVDYDNTLCCGDSVNLALATGTSYVTSTVPLPATLPMFGVALLGLGAIGYGVKRNRDAAA